MKLINIKSVLALTLIVLICTGIAIGESTDTVTLTVTPIYILSINISSTTNTFGSDVSLGSSATICVGQIENDGNISAQWEKQSANSSDGWTLKDSGTPGRDEFRLLAVSTGTTTDPYFTSIEDNRLIEGIHSGVLGSSACSVTTAFTDLTEGGALSPAHLPGEVKNLWISIMMPSNISSSGEQSITLSIRAVLP